MDYETFCNNVRGVLPLNRKERFYTGTVLPALLFHNGLHNFYSFLQQIKRFPSEISESSTADNFLFYTEYSLRDSIRDTEQTITGETPDVIIMILEPARALIFIEAKMFARGSQAELTGQIRQQRQVVGEQLRESCSVDESSFYHLALVPGKLSVESTDRYQVLNWEFFLGNPDLMVEGNYFYNYLRYALENYDSLVSPKSTATTCETREIGRVLYEKIKQRGLDLWVGRQGGLQTIREDIVSGKWLSHVYFVNSQKPATGRPGNWISGQEFLRLVDEYGVVEHRV